MSTFSWSFLDPRSTLEKCFRFTVSAVMILFGLKIFRGVFSPWQVKADIVHLILEGGFFVLYDHKYAKIMEDPPDKWAGIWMIKNLQIGNDIASSTLVG